MDDTPLSAAELAQRVAVGDTSPAERP